MNPISRRTVLSGLSACTAAALTSGVRLAKANAGPSQFIAIGSADGRQLNAFLSLPAQLPAPAVLTIHSSLGLTDWYRSQAAAFAEAGFVGLAVDLFPGQRAWDPDGEQRLIGEAFSDPKRTTQTLVDWVDWLRRDPRTNGKVAIVGWSFGAWWALSASIAAAPDATVMYYGLRYGHANAREQETIELSRLRGQLLAHFGSFDTSIPKAQIDQFRDELDALRKPIEIDWYPANNGFADQTLDGYDQAAAAAAWRRTVEFLHANLASSPVLTGGALHVER
jgi:carboxymethylenebutenolidase